MKPLRYFIRTNFRGHLMSRIWSTNISRALIFAILQKMINLGHSISHKIDKKTALENRFLFNDYLNKEVWKLILRERLNLSHERKNLLHDRYSCLYKRLPGRLADSVIGHLPREISRPTLFFLLRGGVASRGLLSLKS